jgi:hypothetical protein
MIAKILFVLGAATWLIGGNVVVAFHYRRLGQPMWSGFKPFRFPFLRFNAVEWLLLAALMAASFALCIGAISIDPAAPAALFGHPALERCAAPCQR